MHKSPCLPHFYSEIDSLPKCDAYFVTDSGNLFATRDAWYPPGEPYPWQKLGIAGVFTFSFSLYFLSY